MTVPKGEVVRRTSPFYIIMEAILLSVDNNIKHVVYYYTYTLIHNETFMKARQDVFVDFTDSSARSRDATLTVIQIRLSDIMKQGCVA